MEQNETSVLEYMQKQDDRLRNIENLLFSQKNVLNLDEVCNLTGLSKSHIYKLTSSGRIPFYKQSKHCFFDRTEIELWLKANRISTMDELERNAADSLILNKTGGEK